MAIPHIDAQTVFPGKLLDFTNGPGTLGSPKTSYRVKFETNKAIRGMERIEPPKVRIVVGQIGVTKGGLSGYGLTFGSMSLCLGAPLIANNFYS